MIFGIYFMSHLSTLFKPATLTIAIFSVFISSSIFANELTESLPTLDPIVITVSKTEQNMSKTPARINVIDKKNIEKNPTLNLSDILKSDVSVFNRSQWGGIGQPSNLSVRGTNATHTLVLKDGARLNSQNGTSPLYPAFLDLTDIQQIEVLKGSASVQYGSDAIGGVVQMLSKTPEKTGVSMTGIYGENKTYKTIIKGDFVAENGIYTQITGQRLESDGNRIFNTQDKHQKASYDQKGYSAKIGYDNKNNINTSLSISHNEGINVYSDDGISNTAQRQFNNNIITAKASYLINDNFTIYGRHSNVKDKQKIVSRHPANYNTENHDSDIHLKWSFQPSQNIMFGLNHLKSKYYSKNLKDKYKENQSIGYYLQHQYNTNSVNTQIGIRLEDNERFGHQIVGQGAIRYHFTPNTSIYINTGSAFRAPTLDEMYSTFYTSNPHLKPEESMTYELGLNHNITENLSLDFSMYRKNVKNLMRAIDLGGWNYQYQNIDKATFNGGELGLKWVNDNLFATAQYAYVNAQDKSKDFTNYRKQLAYRPKHHGVITLGYDDGKYGVNTTITAHAKSYANSANTVKVGGYTIADVNAHWNINPHIKLFTNIQNIGDVQYKSANYWSNQWYINGGRQANIGITVKY